jgi:hypothetical protein
MGSQICRTAIFVLLVVVIASWTVVAQEQPRVFSLPDAYASEAYRTNAEDVLRDKYGLKLESGSRTAIIQWYLAEGELPPGISLRTDGNIIGTPTSSRDEGYRFRLKIVDVSVKNEELLVDFMLPVKSGRLRLSKIEGPRLVPVNLVTSAAREGLPSPGAEADRDPTRSSSVKTLASSAGSNAPSPQTAQRVRNRSQEEIKTDAEEVAQTPFSGLNKRFILGFEQVGAASTDSEAKPFLDLFVNTPLSKSDERSKISVWGDVQLTSTAEQVKALSGITSNAVDTITGGKLNELTSAFDFTFGPEVRIKDFGHKDISLIAGFGAVSPLSPKQSAQIFQVPDSASSQAGTFFSTYPDAKGKQYIGFVSPDRDRFLRQYFGGIRFKTYTYEWASDKNKEVLKDYFPAMFDVTFGQNEAVTGGRLHKFVVGLDAFYPLPFKDKDERKFLYLFGTAKLKAGGPKMITTPFILDTAPSNVLITDPKVFIADPVQSNRDIFRIGVGVDLIELFKH